MTKFARRYGNYSFLVVTFEVMKALSTFQRMMEEVERNLKFVTAYLDDLVRFSGSLSKHKNYMRQVAGIIANHEL